MSFSRALLFTRCVIRPCVTVACLTLACLTLEGCQTVTPVPGAERVRLTKNPQDVAQCTPSGNIVLVDRDLGPWDLEPEFRNQVVGLGANTAMVTMDLYNALGPPRAGERAHAPVEGVAYQCPEPSTGRP